MKSAWNDPDLPQDGFLDVKLAISASKSPRSVVPRTVRNLEKSGTSRVPSNRFQALFKKGPFLPNFREKSASQGGPPRHFLEAGRHCEAILRPKYPVLRPGSHPGANLGHSKHFSKRVQFYPIFARNRPHKVGLQGKTQGDPHRKSMIWLPKGRYYAPGAYQGQLYPPPRVF